MRSLAYLITALLLQSCSGDESTHRYAKGEQVVLWVNNVGPYFNPQVKAAWIGEHKAHLKRRSLSHTDCAFMSVATRRCTGDIPVLQAAVLQT